MWCCIVLSVPLPSPCAPHHQHVSQNILHEQKTTLPLRDSQCDGLFKTSQDNSVLVYCDSGNWRHISESTVPSIKPVHNTYSILCYTYSSVHSVLIKQQWYKTSTYVQQMSKCLWLMPPVYNRNNELEGHSVECIYLRQRCSDGSVNKPF